MASTEVLAPNFFIHLLLGENGAGKSTFIKVLAGVIRPDQGQMFLESLPMRFSSPNAARKMGVSAVFQELSLIPTLSVWQNIWLGQEILRNGHLALDAMRLTAEKWMKKLGAKTSVDAIVSQLTLADQQLVEVAKSLVCDPKIWVLDEPTSSLYQEQVERLFDLIRERKSQGCSVIYITHRLAEAFRIADKVTIFRDGTKIGTYLASEISAHTAVTLMSAEDERSKAHFASFRNILTNAPLPADVESSTPRLVVKNLQVGSKVKHLTFDLYPGEILGFAGLQGHGQEEILYALSGALNFSGSVKLDGELVHLRTPRVAIRKGIILLSGDRKDTSVLVSSSARNNIALSSLDRRQFMGWIKIQEEKDEVDTVSKQLFLKQDYLDRSAGDLSGGSQQKLAIGRVLLARPRILILDDPTRGVDVNTKTDFYSLLKELASEGMAIILSSSDTSELVELADRVLVLRSGQVVAVLSKPEDITVDRIVQEAFQK